MTGAGVTSQFIGKVALVSVFQSLCLVNKHYRDAVFNWIKKFAVVANEAGFICVQPDIAFAFGTCQYIKKIFTYCHLIFFLPVHLDTGNYI